MSIDNTSAVLYNVLGGIMEHLECLERLGFSSNEAKVYTTLLKNKVLNGYEVAKLSGVARSLVYEVINRLVSKGYVIRLDGTPNFYKCLPYEQLLEHIKQQNSNNLAEAESILKNIANDNCQNEYVMNIVGQDKYLAQVKEVIDNAQSEISMSVWNSTLQLLEQNITQAIKRNVKVYIFAFQPVKIEGATVFSYNIDDAEQLFPYRRNTVVADGNECIIGEVGDAKSVYVYTRNHAIMSLATDEMVLNIFWQKYIKSQQLLQHNNSSDSFIKALQVLANRFEIDENMTKNHAVYNFQHLFDKNKKD